MAEETINESQKVISYELNGISGVWMPLEMANKAATDALLVPALQKKISELELLYSIRLERFQNVQTGLYLAEDERDLAIALSVREEARRIAVEEKLKAWYRNPVMWFSVGVVVAVAAETALITATK